MKVVNVVTAGEEGSGMFLEIWGLDENQNDACLARGPLSDDDNARVELDTQDKRAIIVQQ